MRVETCGSDEQILRQSWLIERFETHIRSHDFPCVGAKSALARHRMPILVAGDIRCPRDDQAIYAALRDFARAFHADPQPFQSFAVLFDQDEMLDEDAFEQALWQRVASLEQIDARAGFSYDPRVSDDIEDPRFCLSFAGEAFFVVGLHPGAARPSRRFDVPVLVFNAHQQFETLRREGRYDTLRASIIKRDVALSGSHNPMLSRHGDMSEARQYSGRVVDGGWVCPVRIPMRPPGAQSDA
ncbi:MAG: guanitoxin biosynthesis heme-dependent pre-guanitoxin N-hydroxylase GntA [Asticcacaulis sp.]